MISRKQKDRKRVVVALSSVINKLALDLQIDLTDRNYVLRRLQREGVKFLTVTLPNFSKFVIRSCSLGFLDHKNKGITSFVWQRRSPVFMSGLLNEAISGNPSALYRIRQFCEYFYKTAFDPTNQELEKARQKYLDTDQAVKTKGFDEKWVNVGRKALFNLFPRLTSLLPHEVFLERPCDGPGSVADSHLLKMAFGLELEQIKKLPMSKLGTVKREFAAFSGYFKSYPSSSEEIKLITESRIADLAFVPKDSRGPRTISKEPLFLLKGQMSFQKTVSRLLETESNFRINFADQTVNQKLCKTASMDGHNATLDLKDASDRVGLGMIRCLINHAPALEFFVKNARSTHVRYTQ